jgi:hypothetical protein
MTEKDLKKENTNDKKIDTNDLINMNDYSKDKLKQNYINNLITWKFLKNLCDYHQWPLGCIGNLIQNSLKPHIQSKNIYLDIIENKENEIILTIKDDGIGISCVEFNGILYSFNKNENEELYYFQYGLNLKTSALRLADSFFILTKRINEASIGLISKNLQKEISNDFILTPIINYKIEKTESKNKKNKYIPQSNYPSQCLDLILQHIKSIFETKEKLYEYLDSFEIGTHLFLYDLKKINDEYEFDFNKEKYDIYYNTFYEELGFDDNLKKMLIDISLVQYLNFIQIKHINAKIHIFGKELILKNLYHDVFLSATLSNDLIKIKNLKYESENENEKEKINCFYIEGDEYKGILFNEEFLNSLGQNPINNVDDLLDKDDYFNGILIYRENDLICRIDQSNFGDLSYFINKFVKGKNKSKLFRVNGYIQLPIRGYELLFNNKEIKDLSLYGYLYKKIKTLVKKIKK